MNRTIVLGGNGTFSGKTNKIAWIFNGVLLFSLGIIEMLRQTDELFGTILSILLILGGVYGILYAILGLSKNSKFSPKVILSNESLTIKKSFWKPSFKIKWDEISSINFNHYQIDFQLNNEVYSFEYETNAHTSLEIKKSIREYAESKEIEVFGG